jgi:DNA-binding MarR family transcriptional regulator
MTVMEPEILAGSLQRFGLARDQMRSALASSSGLIQTDLDALEHLESDGPLTQRQLGDRLSLTSGAITMLVDRLEQGGWVHRRRHPSDRRSVFVELSAQAAERTPPGLAAYHARIRAIAASVPEEHRDIIKKFLQAAAEAASGGAAELRRRPAS